MKLPAPFLPRRILVLQLRQIGDVLLTTPALAALRRRFPTADIQVLTELQCAPLLRGNPDVNGIIELDKKKLRSFWRGLAWYWKASRGFDLVIDFQQLPRCRVLTLFSGAPVRLAASPRWYSRLLYNILSPRTSGEYSAWDKVEALAPLGIVNMREPPRIFLSEEEKKAARTLLVSLGLLPGLRLVTLDPTHRRMTRRWPASHYAALVGLLHSAAPDLRFMPLWGPGEEGDILALCNAMPETVRSAVLLPDHMLTLREMAACIAEASLHIGNCSAPQHIAAAVGTPSCIIRGSTGGEWRYPSPIHASVAANLPCQPCQKNECPHCRCLTQLSPEKVVDVALGLLERH